MDEKKRAESERLQTVESWPRFGKLVPVDENGEFHVRVEVWGGGRLKRARFVAGPSLAPVVVSGAKRPKLPG